MPPTRFGVLRLAESEGWATRPRPGRGRTGMEYRLADLPPETQQAFAVRATGAIRPAVEAIAAGDHARLVVQAQARASAVAQHGLLIEASSENTGFDPASNPRLDLFNRFDIYHRARGIAVWPAMLEFCGLWQAGVIEAHPGTLRAYPSLPAKTLDKWYRAWRTQGVVALLERKPRKDAGRTALSANEDLYQVFLAAVAEMHAPSAQQVGRVIRAELGADRVPPLRTLSRWLADFRTGNAAALLRFKNPDGWRNKFMVAFGSQSDTITRPNQQWQQDSTVGDAQQRAELAFNTVEPGTGEIRRHAIIASIDVFTRRVKVVVARTSNSNAVKAVTRLCMQDWGRPESIKTDNGRDYTAQDFDFALQSLGIEHPLCTPFTPQQKPYVERFIGTLMHDLFPMLEGFVGHSVVERKAIDSAKSFAERFGDKGVDLRMGPQQLQDIINGWLVEYHEREHSGLGCSPNEMAARHVNQVVRLDDRALDLFLMPVAGKGTRVVTKVGISMGRGTAFKSPELAAHVGKTVRCRQADGDLGRMHVFHLDGSYICEALDYTQLGINQAELAAKSRQIEAQSIKPMVDALRKAKRKGLTRQAVQSIYAEREAKAATAAGNVHRMPAREVAATTSAIDSLLAHLDTTDQDAARSRARATLEADAPTAAAPVAALATPNDRYSAWLRLQARMGRGEAISAREQAWAQSYGSSNECEAWHTLHEGVDPLEASG